jgi:ribosomal protein L14E/L6E/L27E
MDIVKGSIVKAKAGRDKGGFFVVLGVDGTLALIADGKRRRVERPKRKKLIHLMPTATVYNGLLETNPQVKRALRDFLNNGG